MGEMPCYIDDVTLLTFTLTMSGSPFLQFVFVFFWPKKLSLARKFIMSDPLDTCSIKRFCRRCKAHSFKVAVHSACPFRNCQCPDCSKIAQNNEVARERARRRRADQTAALTLIPTCTDIAVTASFPIGEEIFAGRSGEETTLNISASSRYVSA